MCLSNLFMLTTISYIIFLLIFQVMSLSANNAGVFFQNASNKLYFVDTAVVNILETHFIYSLCVRFDEKTPPTKSRKGPFSSLHNSNCFESGSCDSGIHVFIDRGLLSLIFTLSIVCVCIRLCRWVAGRG